MPPLLLATRNRHKVREIADLLAGVSVELTSLIDIGAPLLPGEDEVEVYNSFEQNALAKAEFYRHHTGFAVLADDSGLCVDALDGAPGVRSRRFAPDGGATPDEQDRANNEHLLARLEGIPPARRGAHYRCALALVGATRTLLLSGRVGGAIAEEPAGEEGFGYDPLFLVPSYGRTFGELDPSVKAGMSHRAEAVRSLRRWLTPPFRTGGR